MTVGMSALLPLASLEQRFVHGTGAGPPLLTYLRQNLEPGDTIAVDQAGLLAYGLPLEIRVIDLNGLTDAHIAHRPVALPGGLFGRGDGFGKWDIDYVLAQNPRFVQVFVREIRDDGRYTTGNTGQTLLVNDPRFRRRYQLVSVHKRGVLPGSWAGHKRRVRGWCNF